MDKLTINSGSGYKLTINNVEQDKIELGVDSILPPVVCGDVTSEQLAAALAAIELTPGPQGPAGPQGEQGDPADPAALDDLQTQIDAIYKPGEGGLNQIIPSVSNGTYENGVLTYTGGELLPGVPAAGVIIDGLARLEFAGNTQAVHATCSNAATGFDELFLITPDTRPCLSASIESTGADYVIVTIGWSTVGDSGNNTVTLGNGPFAVEFLVDRVVLTVGEMEYISPVCPVPLVTPYTKVLALSSAEVSFFTSSSGASGLLPDETAARIAGDAALAQTVADVQTLAQVNQLNITGKADQIDLDTLQTTVTGQGLTLAQKADQTALDTLGTVVSGKATPADITAAIAALVDGAPAALDTLAELAAALSGEQAQIADLLSALALRVRVDAIQSLTLAQQLQARQNINAEAVGVAAGLVAAITPAGIGAATAVQGAKADTALQSADVAPVALSGQYSALTGLPTIPGLSSSTPAAPTTSGTAGTANTAARGDHAHPLPTPSQITAAVLTGLATGSATAIAAADSILQALEKLQAQASANATNISTNSGLLAPAERKIGASWYVSGSWYDVEYPRFVSAYAGATTLGLVNYFPRQILEDATFSSLAFYCSTGAAGAVAYAGIYSDSGGQPESLLASFSAGCSTTGTKSGSISLSLTAGQIVWDAFLMVGAAAQVNRYLTTRALQMQTQGVVANTHTSRFKTGQTDLAATATGTSTTQAVSAPRLMLQCA